MLEYDTEHLKGTLDHLAAWKRVAFSAACASRLLPAYRVYCKRWRPDDAVIVETALDFSWNAVIDIENSRILANANITSMEALFPQEELACYLDEVAERTVSCACYTMQSILTGNSQYAAWAALAVHDCIVRFVDLRDAVDYNAPGALKAMIADPLVQRELSRQERDLKLLSAMESDPSSVLVEEFRAMIDMEAALPHLDKIEWVN